MTLQQLSARRLNIPVATSWLLADPGEAKGKQDLYSKREPERLRVLREHALIESYDPEWNASGFGSHVPGRGRPGIRVSRWDKEFPPE